MKLFLFALLVTACLGAASALEVGDRITRRVATAETRNIYGAGVSTTFTVELAWEDEKKRENATAVVSVRQTSRDGPTDLILSSISIEDLVKIRNAFDKAIKKVEAE